MEIFMNGELSLFFFLKSILEKILNYMDPLIFSNTLFKKMPEFYREMLRNWSKFLLNDPSLPSTILLQYLWFNKHIKTGNNSVYFSHFSNYGINFIGNLVDINGKNKSWDAIKFEYNLTDREKFWRLQLVHAIPKLWVEVLNMDVGLSINLAIYDHNLIKNCRLYTLDKLVSKELYNISLSSMYEKPTSQRYYEELLETTNLNWKKNMHFTKQLCRWNAVAYLLYL